MFLRALNFLTQFKCFQRFLKHAMPSVLWRCWLGGRKGIWPVKTEWWGARVVICLERAANDLHVVQLMPLLPPSSLAPVKSRMVYLSGTDLPRSSWKRPLLNGRSSSSSQACYGSWLKAHRVMQATLSTNHWRVSQLVIHHQWDSKSQRQLGDTISDGIIHWPDE